jgi:hypothetical protein
MSRIGRYRIVYHYVAHSRVAHSPRARPMVGGVWVHCTDYRYKRDAGATLREEDRRQGHLPRSGALHPRNLREEQRPQMGMRDAVGGGPLGFSGMGLALSCCPGSFRALCRCAGQTTQEDIRVGLAAAPASKAMVPTAGDRGRGRSSLRIVQTARPQPQAPRPDHLRHPLALRWGCERMSRIDGRKLARRGGRWKKGQPLRARCTTGAR